MMYSDGTTFRVSADARSVWATWPTNLTLEDTLTYLLGPVFGVILRLRGVVCLHASAVVVGGRALAFVGPAGSGKSTMAAAFVASGYEALTDDVLALRQTRNGDLLVEPGYARLRLWPESVATLFGSPDALPLLTPNWDKRYLDLRDPPRHHVEAAPLGAIYILGRRRPEPDGLTLEAVSGQAAVMTFVGNTYAHEVPDLGMRVKELDLLGKIACEIPVRRVVAHTDPCRIWDLRDLILDDFSTSG